MSMLTVAGVGVAVGTVIAFEVRTHGKVHCCCICTYSPLCTVLVSIHRNAFGGGGSANELGRMHGYLTCLWTGWLANWLAGICWPTEQLQ